MNNSDHYEFRYGDRVIGKKDPPYGPGNRVGTVVGYFYTSSVDFQFAIIWDEKFGSNSQSYCRSDQIRKLTPLEDLARIDNG